MHRRDRICSEGFFFEVSVHVTIVQYEYATSTTYLSSEIVPLAFKNVQVSILVRHFHVDINKDNFEASTRQALDQATPRRKFNCSYSPISTTLSDEPSVFYALIAKPESSLLTKERNGRPVALRSRGTAHPSCARLMLPAVHLQTAVTPNRVNGSWEQSVGVRLRSS